MLVDILPICSLKGIRTGVLIIIHLKFYGSMPCIFMFIKRNPLRRGKLEKYFYSA